MFNPPPCTLHSHLWRTRYHLLELIKLLLPQVLAAVAAVISALHGAAGLVAKVRKKQSRLRNEREHDEERQLQIYLETAERQLGFRFSADEAKFGHTVRVGDGPFPLCFSEVRNQANLILTASQLLHATVYCISLW